jgi:hypothetical protein
LVICFSAAGCRIMWQEVSEISGLPSIVDFESLGKYWLRGKNYKAFNVLTTAVIWSIWKTRNNLCFQGAVWARMEVLFYTCAKLIRKWMLLCKQEDAMKLETWRRCWKEEAQDHLAWRGTKFQDLRRLMARIRCWLVV